MDVKVLVILKCFFILLLYFNSYVRGDTPFGLCADPACSVPVSKGITIFRYSSPDGDRLSVEPNVEVEIFVKDYGPKKNLLGIQVKEGVKGYVAKTFIKETATLIRKLVPANSDFRTPLASRTNVVSSHVHRHDSVVTDEASTTFVHIHYAQSSVSSLHDDPGETLQSSHLSEQIPPSDHAHVDLHSHFDHSLETLNFPEQSSHFDLNSKNILTSTDVTGLKSEYLSSQSQTPDVQHSSLHHKGHLLHSSFPEGDFSEPHLKHQSSFDYLNNKDSDYNPVISTKISGFSYQSEHQPKFQSEYMLSSYDYDSAPFDDDDDDEELSKTLAMLSKRGMDNTGIYINSQSDPNIGLSSHNNEVKYDVSERELKPEPSQFLYQPPVENSGASVYSSVDSNPSVNSEERILNSKTVKDVQDSVDMPSLDVLDDESNDHNATDVQYKMTNYDEKKENLLNESDKEILAEGEEEEEEGNDNDYTLDSITDENSDIYIEENISKSKPSLESSMNSVSVTPQKSTTENPNIDSVNIIETFSKESETFSKESEIFSKESETSSKEFETSSKESETFSKESETFSKESETFSKESETFINEKKILKESMFTSSESNFANSFTPHSEIYPSISPNLIEEKTGFYDSNSKDKAFSNSESHTFATPAIVEVKSINSDTSSENELKSQNIPQLKNIVSDNLQPIPNDILQEESLYIKENASSKGTDNQNSEFSESLNNLSVGLEEGLSSTYQTRNLKGEYTPSEDHQSDSESSADENNTEPGSSFYSPFENGLDSIKSFVDSLMSWVPEPFYSAVMDLQSKGISPRVPVFTALCGFIIIILIVPVYYIKESSKESKLSAQLANIEKKAYTLSAANIVLEEKLECAQSELSTLQASLDLERNISAELRTELDKQAKEYENIKPELESYVEECDSLREKENEYLSLLNEHSKEKEELIEHKNSLEKIIKDQEDSLGVLSDQLQESEKSLKELEKEKVQYIQFKEDYEEKLAQSELNCNQLLQEAEVWNLKVNELTSKLNEENFLKGELETSLKLKDEEIESLKQLVETFNAFNEIEDPEEQEKTREEKLQTLMKSSMILNQLKKQEEENKILDEQLGKEKSKILEIEVEMLEAKSEIDKLKVNYNQALQDKAEAQTKLDVLTNYFKDKEIQLQKQLGVHEAVRQKKEEDVNSAERRICLIEQENASYKYQVASMKQEMEETERNLKSQIAVQEKKAHENWIAARAAERKLEDMKQEVTQLRQRLTLLEREQENWANSSRDEILKPVPKRMPGTNEEPGNQDLNASDRSMFHYPLNDRLPVPPPHMILPPDRPLPPLPPPPLPPMFLPPMERHFRPQPWHIPPDPGPEFRTTPPEFITGRESTPPRGRQSGIIDGDTGPHASSPLTTDARDSRNSTPPHLLPDFHDVPPQPGRPFFPPPPPLGQPRSHMHPSYRRDVGPGHKRLDNPNEYSSRGQQQPPATSQEQWQHSRV